MRCRAFFTLVGIVLVALSLLSSLSSFKLLQVQALLRDTWSSDNRNSTNDVARVIQTATLPNISRDDVVLSYSTSDMQTFVEDGFRGNFCTRIFSHPRMIHHPSNETRPQQRVVVQVSFDCHTVFSTSGYGTGNFLTSMYILRSVAGALGGVDIAFSCTDAQEQKHQLILPWLTGWFPSQNIKSNTTLSLNQTTIARRCKQLQRKLRTPLAERVKDIRFDLRRMAVALVGVPNNDHPSFAERSRWLQMEGNIGNKTGHSVPTLPTPRIEDPPILPDVELDDAAIHFRCGDLIDSEEPRYGFMKFDSYARHISSQVHSIGIVTESFDSTGQYRPRDGREVTRTRCRTVVEAFVAHLQSHFPEARVRIRNGRGETVALSYARLIMANQTVVSTSTFAVFPAVASFGQALIRRPSPRDLGGWLVKAKIEDRFENIFLINEPDWLPTKRCKRLWGEDGSKVLEWFRSPSSQS